MMDDARTTNRNRRFRKTEMSATDKIAEGNVLGRLYTAFA